MKVNGKKILKYFSISLISIIALLVMVVFSLRIPAVQNFVKDRLVTYLQDKIHTKVSLERVYIGFPNSLVMENLYLQGKDVDTLLSVRKLDVGLDIPKLISSKADITSVDLEGTRATVIRYKNGTFNFDYIVNAFATKDEEESTSRPFIISLDKIRLKDIGVSFNDQQQGNHIKVYFKALDTRVRTFDMDKNSYAVDDISMDGLRLKLKQDIVKEVAQKVEQKVDSLNRKNTMKLALKGIHLTDFDIDYGDDNSRTFAKVKFRELETRVNSLDLDKNAYDVDHVSLKGARIAASLYLPESKEKTAETASSGASGAGASSAMDILLGRLLLDDVQIAYNNTAAKPVARGMDFNHLQFGKMNLDMEDFKMQNGTFSGKVKSAEIQEKKGLNIQKFTTDFLYASQQAYLKNLYLQTPKTLIRDELMLSYQSLDALTQNPGNIKLSASLRNSRIAFSDILNLVPDLRNTTPFDQYPNAVLNVSTKVGGSVNNLMIQNLQLTGIDKTVIVASGNVRNAMNPKDLYYDLNIKELTTQAKTVYRLVPKNTIPSNITLPSSFTVRGRAKGTTAVVNTQLAITSTLGNARINAVVDMRRKNREQYDVKANLQNLQMGKIIQNQDMGAVTGQIAAKGESFDFKRAKAEVSGHIRSIVYNKYRYQDMSLKGKINRGAYYAEMHSLDPNAHLDLTAAGVYNEKQPNIRVNGSILKLDLQKLGFYANPMIVAGKIDGDFSNLNPDDLNGVLRLQNFALSDTKEVFPVQEMNFKAVSDASHNELTLQSQVADISMNGKYRLTQIFGALQQTVNRYYQFQKTDGKTKITPGQYMTFSAIIKNDDLIRKFVPDLTSFETITLNGNFNADSGQLEVEGQIPQLTYGSNNLENGTLKITNENSALQYALHLESLKSESFALNKIDLSGDVSDNIIRYRATSRDEDDKEKFLLSGTAKSIRDITEISLDPDGFMLNYSSWKVASDNKISIGNNGIIADNFSLSDGESEIRLQSQEQKFSSPLDITIKNFKLETLAEMIKKDSLPAKGIVDGTVQLHNLTKELTFSSDLKVSQLELYGNPVGDLSAKVHNESASMIAADIALGGNSNDVKLSGTYNTKSSGFDMNMDINRLEMKSVQGFSMNQIVNAEGYLSGNLKISGTTSAPSVLGKVKFNDAGMMIAKTGSDFRKIDDEIDFTSQGIEFNRFNLKDADGNAMVIDGLIGTRTYRDFAFNLNIRAKDFMVVNSEQSSDAMMYGKLAVNASLQVRGDLDLPKVDGRIAVTDKTNFTFVMPQDSPTLQEREGIVEFIDQDQVALQQTIKADSEETRTRLTGMDVNVNIEVNKEAKMSIIVDKTNGDFVELQGEAELTGGIDPSGKTTLVGVYQVEKGAYELSVSLVKRKFDIQKGSTITWTGEPTSAQLNITAIYKTEAAPIDLLEQQLSGMSSSELNQYKQRMPFNTLLILKGELMKPEISFDITTDENNHSVSTAVLDNTKAKLGQMRTDEAEMNKQVFALLALNRFIGDNPFQSQSGMSAESMARQSVSKILSQQLNSLASDLISGVDLNFDLESSEFYSSGEKNNRTDLNVDISKSLLNDRLKVTVGSNFGLEGDARQNEQMTNIAGDVSVDYSLSRDGRYMLRAYRKNEYQVALQGQIIETGIGFIITLDYDKFREIFQRQKKNRQSRMIQKNNAK